MRSRLVVAPAVVSLAFALAGCGDGSAESSGATSTTGGAPSAAVDGVTSSTQADGGGAAALDPVEVPSFLDFTAETVHGQRFTGADYAGKDLVLWFWAPW